MRTHRLVADRYRMLEQVRDTGAGSVWRALDEWSDRQVGLFEVPGRVQGVLDPAVYAGVAREVSIASRVRSDHLVRVWAAIADAGTVWLVSEGLAGRTLRGVLQAYRVTVSDVLSWGRDAADGLAAAHGAGVVHGDVHAGLVMLGDDGHARLAGLALTHPDLGTGGPPHHGAPELAAGGTRSPAGDVFGWAAMVRAALEHAGDGHGGGELVEHLLGHALSPEPARRPDAATAARELTALLTARVTARPSAPPAHLAWAGPPAPPAEAGTPTSERHTGPVMPPAGTPPHRPTGPPPTGPPPTGPPIGPPPTGWSPEVWPPHPPATSRRRVALAVIAVFALLAGAGVIVLNATSRPVPPPAGPPAPPSLLGDTRTADPCSLVSPDSVRPLGKGTVHPDYLSPAACGVEVTVSPGFVVLTVEFDTPEEADPRENVQQVDGLRILRTPVRVGECQRTIVLPDQLRVEIRAESRKGALTDLCAVAETAMTVAMTALNNHAVRRRPLAVPANALTTVDFCTLADPATFSAIPGIDTARRRPGLNAWSCIWGRGDAGAPGLVLGIVAYRAPPTAREIAPIGGRRAWSIDASGLTLPTACYLYLHHRTYVAESGERLDEYLAVTAYAGPQPNADLSCAQAVTVANAVAPKLPPAG